MKRHIAVILCLILAISMFASACGLIGKKDYPDPQDTLDDLLAAMVAGDSEKLSEISGEEIDFDYSDYDEQTKDLMVFFFEQIEAEVNGEPKFKGKTAEMSVTFTVPDFNAAVEDVLDNENNDFITLLVKDLLLATINGEDTTAIQDKMFVDFIDEIKDKMADPTNKSSSESTMKMKLNKEGDAWIIDEVDENFIDPSTMDVDSDEIAVAVEKAVTDAVPGALDLLLEEGSIDQATYDMIIAAF